MHRIILKMVSKRKCFNREQTLRGMTIWAAKWVFQEKERGSLEVGKNADFYYFEVRI